MSAHLKSLSQLPACSTDEKIMFIAVSGMKGETNMRLFWFVFKTDLSIAISNHVSGRAFQQLRSTSSVATNQRTVCFFISLKLLF